MNPCIPEHHWDEFYFRAFDIERAKFDGSLTKLSELVGQYFGDDERAARLYEVLADHWNCEADEVAAERAEEALRT